MAARVNTRFVLILSAVIIGLVMSITAFGYYKLRRDPVRLEREADRFVEQGEYKLALEKYRRAIGRDQSNVELLEKYAQLLLTKPVEDRVEAGNNYRNLLAARRMKTEARPTDQELLTEYYDTITMLAERLHSEQFYDHLHQQASTRLQADPQSVVAKRYRGLAGVKRLSFDMPRDEQLQILQDLEAAAEHDAGDADVRHGLAMWHLFESRRLARVRAPEEETLEHLNLSLELAKENLERNADDPVRKLEYAQILLQAREVDEQVQPEAGIDRVAEAAPYVEELEQHLLQSTELVDTLVMGTAQLLPLIDQEMVEMGPDNRRVLRGLQRQVKLYEHAAEVEPDQAVFALQLGHVRKRLGDATGALAAFEQARQIDLHQPAIPAAVNHNLRLSATTMLADTLLGTVNDAETDVQRQAIVERVKSLLAEVEKAGGGEDARALLLRGKLAALEGRTAEAAQLYDRAANAGGDYEALMLASNAWRKLGERGTAAARIESLLEVRPGLTPLRLELAQLYMQDQRFDEADPQIDQVFRDQVVRDLAEHFEDDEDARLRVRIQIDEADRQAQRGLYDEANRTLRRLADAHPQIAGVRLMIAKNLLEQERYAEASARIAETIGSLPENDPRPTALLLMGTRYSTEGEYEAAAAVLEPLRSSGEPAVVRALAAVYAETDRDADAVALLTERLDEEPTDLVSLQVLFRVSQDADQKLAYLERAREAGANDRALVVLEESLAGEGQIDVARLNERLIEKIDDPLVRQLTYVRLHRMQGDMDQARAALAEARKIDPDSQEVFEHEFDFALLDRDWDKARQLAARAAQKDYDLARGHFYLGRLAAVQGDLDRAISEYREGLELRPVYSEGWRTLGELHLRRGDARAAVEAYERAVEQKPTDVAAVRGLAGALDMRGEHAEALQRIRRVVDLRPNDARLMELYLDYEQTYGDAQAALEMREELAESAPDNTENLRALARIYSKLEQHGKAQELANRLLNEEGQTMRNVATLATVLSASGDRVGGLNVIERYLASRGDEATAEDYVMMARYKLNLGDGDGAMAAYRAARLREDPLEMEVSREIADILFRRGAFEAAAKYYGAVHEANPQERNVSLRLAEALIRDGQLDEAESLLTDMPEDQGTLLLRARIASDRDDPATAFRLLTRAIEKDTRKAQPYIERARLLAQDRSQQSAAISDLNRALSIDQEAHDARRLLADLYLRRGETQEAIREMRNLLNRRPGDSATRLKLYELYAAQGEPTTARLLLAEGAEQDPDNAVWPALMAELAAREGNDERAMEHWLQAVTLDPSVDNVSGFTALLIKTGKAEQALRLLSENAALVNGSPTLQGLRGSALVKAGRQEQGERVFTRALERAESMGDVTKIAHEMFRALGAQRAIVRAKQASAGAVNPAWIQITIAEFEAASQQIPAALSRLRTIDRSELEGDPEAALKYDQLLAPCLYAGGEYEECREVYRRLLKVNPEDASTMNNLAYLLADDLGDVEAALPLAQKAVDLNPLEPNFLDTLGYVQLLAGRLTDARLNLERSVNIQAMPSNTLHLAQVLIELGVMDRARELLDLSIRLGEQGQQDEYAEQARKTLEQLSRS